MARIDVEEYRRMYLKEVQDRIMEKKDQIPNYSSKLLNDALLEVINMKADPDTWEVEVPDDKEMALKDAETKILDIMGHNKDLGTGKSW
ncbi:MAG: hypothetical protein P8Y85_03920 [Nitrospirota bacterium]|jgi:hypothetical protein